MRGGSLRATYADVGRAVRGAHARAVASGDMTSADWRVLCTVIAMVASWSRLTDTMTAEQVAQQAGLHPRTAKRALAHLVDLGVLERLSTGGRRAARTGFPTVATVATVEDHQTSRNSGDTEHGSHVDNPSQPWRKSPPNSGDSRHPSEKNLREESDPGTAPPGRADGPAARVTVLPGEHGPPVELTEMPRLFDSVADDVTDPVIRSMLRCAASRGHNPSGAASPSALDVSAAGGGVGRDTARKAAI